MTGPYGAFEIITYGGGQQFVGALNSIALLSGHNVLTSFFRLILLLGLIMGVFQAAVNFKVGELLKWFIMISMIQGVIWLPRVQVHVSDSWNPGLQGATIGNIPLGIALVASVSTEVGDFFVQETQTAFNDPSDLSFSATGMVYGPRLFAGIQGMQITSPVLAQNLGQFFDDCVMDDIVTGYLPMDTVLNSPSLFTAVTTNLNASYYTTQMLPTSSGGTGQGSMSAQVEQCTTAVSQLQQAFTNEVTQQQTLQLNQLFPWLQASTGGSSAPTNPLPSIDSSIGDYSTMATGSTSNSSALFQQALTATALKQEFALYSGKSGNNGIQTLAQLQGEVQNTATSQATGVWMQKAIPILQMVLMLLCISVFPLMVPLFFLPGVGLKIMQSYFGIFASLQLWGPMLVILNQIFMTYGASATTSAAYLPAGVSAFGGQTAITLANMAAVANVNAQISNVCGMMMASIPVLSGMLVAGVSSGVGAMTASLGTFAQSAQTAGQMVSTGNVSRDMVSMDGVSMANTSIGTASRFNDSERKVDTAASQITHGATIDTASGDRIMTSDTGQKVYTAAMSQIPTGLNVASSIANSLEQRSAESARIAETKQENWGKAISSTHELISNYGTGYNTSKGYQISQGGDARGQTHEVLTVMDQIANDYAKRWHVSTDQAQQTVKGWAATIDGKLGYGGGAKDGGALGFRGGVDGGFTGRYSSDRTDRDAEGASVDSRFTEAQHKSLSNAIDQSRAAFATNLDTTTGANTTSGGNQTQQSYRTGSEYRKSIDDAKALSEEYAKSAQSVRSSSGTVNQNYSNSLTSAFGDYWDQHPEASAWGLLGARPADRDNFILGRDASGRQDQAVLSVQRQIADQFANQLVDREFVKPLTDKVHADVDNFAVQAPNKEIPRYSGPLAGSQKNIQQVPPDQLTQNLTPPPLPGSEITPAMKAQFDQADRDAVTAGAKAAREGKKAEHTAAQQFDPAPPAGQPGSNSYWTSRGRKPDE